MLTETRLHQIMEQKGISQLELARRAKMSPGDLNQVINGKRYCFPGWRKRIAKALEVSIEDLFGGGYYK